MSFIPFNILKPNTVPSEFFTLFQQKAKQYHKLYNKLKNENKLKTEPTKIREEVEEWLNSLSSTEIIKAFTIENRWFASIILQMFYHHRTDEYIEFIFQDKKDEDQTKVHSDLNYISVPLQTVKQLNEYEKQDYNLMNHFDYKSLRHSMDKTINLQEKFFVKELVLYSLNETNDAISITNKLASHLNDLFNHLDNFSNNQIFSSYIQPIVRNKVLNYQLPDWFKFGEYYHFSQIIVAYLEQSLMIKFLFHKDKIPIYATLYDNQMKYFFDNRQKIINFLESHDTDDKKNDLLSSINIEKIFNDLENDDKTKVIIKLKHKIPDTGYARYMNVKISSYEPVFYSDSYSECVKKINHMYFNGAANTETLFIDDLLFCILHRAWGHDDFFSKKIFDAFFEKFQDKNTIDLLNDLTLETPKNAKKAKKKKSINKGPAPNEENKKTIDIRNEAFNIVNEIINHIINKAVSKETTNTTSRSTFLDALKRLNTMSSHLNTNWNNNNKESSSSDNEIKNFNFKQNFKEEEEELLKSPLEENFNEAKLSDNINSEMNDINLIENSSPNTKARNMKKKEPKKPKKTHYQLYNVTKQPNKPKEKAVKKESPTKNDIIIKAEDKPLVSNEKVVEKITVEVVEKEQKQQLFKEKELKNSKILPIEIQANKNSPNVIIMNNFIGNNYINTMNHVPMNYPTLIPNTLRTSPIIHRNMDFMPNQWSIHPFEYKLHNDIIIYSNSVQNHLNLIKPYKEEAIEFIIGIINNTLDNVKVETYGSYATDLDIESSDIDIKVSYFESTMLNYSSDYLITNLVKKFESLKKFDSITPIYTASVPIIKLVINPLQILSQANMKSFFEFLKSETLKNYLFDKEELTKVKIDITFIDEEMRLKKQIMNVQTSPVDYIKESLIFYPEIKPIMQIIKRYLQIKKINNIYKGGLSSYCLYLLLLGFVKYKNVKYFDYGRLLSGFFEFYGKYFNFHNTAVNVALVNPFFNNNYNFDGIPVIIDPLSYANAGKGAFKINEVQNTFLLACDALSMMRANYDNTKKGNIIMDFLLFE